MADGLCKCGCGRRTKIAERNRRELGWVKGHPIPTILGHGKARPRGKSREIMVNGTVCRTIPLSSGREAIVDAADYEWLSQWLWSDHERYATRDEYTNGKGKTLRMHRLILGLSDEDGAQGDHINGNTLDNRRCNLRQCTQEQNARNRGVATVNRSGVTGVHWDNARQRWCAQIRQNGHRRHLGFFDSVAAAAQVRKSAEDKYYGEFVRRGGR